MARDLHIRQNFKGYTAIYGQRLDDLVAGAFECAELQALPKQTSRHEPHITLLLKDEARTIVAQDPPSIKLLLSDSILDDIHVVGLGAVPAVGAYHLVVLCPAANRIRAKLGLPLKDFRLTLADERYNSGQNGLDSLLPGDWPAEPS